jgi:hypothetical protein
MVEDLGSGTRDHLKMPKFDDLNLTPPSEETEAP